MGKNCCTQEFTLSNFKLNHENPVLFVTSQWSGNPLPYLIYRVVCAIYFIVWIFLSGADQINYDEVSTRLKWFIYLTNWSFLVLTLTLIMEAVMCVLAYSKVNEQRNKEGAVAYPEGMPWYLKMTWVLYNIATLSALTVTGAYWGLLYRGGGVSDISINTHAVNSIYVLLDLFITAIPIRLLHVYQPILYAVVYTIFSALYEIAGGTNENGNSYIYEVLDWSNPGKALLYAALVGFVAMSLLWTLTFGLYQLRIYIDRTCRGKAKVNPVSDERTMADQDAETMERF